MLQEGAKVEDYTRVNLIYEWDKVAEVEMVVLRGSSTSYQLVKDRETIQLLIKELEQFATGLKGLDGSRADRVD